MYFLDINYPFFTVLGYRLSYLEFFGLATGLAAVALSSRAHLWSWPVGIINVVLSFFLFYQVQLYPDMLLQIFFFATNLVGWWRWANPRPGEEDRRKQLKISRMPKSEMWVYGVISGMGIVVLSTLARQVHIWFPAVFSEPSAAPWLDSTITVLSISTTFLMIRKRLECWLIWIFVDLLATYVYFMRDIRFYSLMYLIFCGIAAYGFVFWWREYRAYQVQRL